jgi:hypothetical protein
MLHEYLTLLAIVAILVGALSLVLLSPPRRRPQVAAAGGASTAAARRSRARSEGPDRHAAPIAHYVSGLYEANLSAVDLPEELELPEELMSTVDQLVPAAHAAASVAPARHTTGWQSNVLFFGLLTVLYTIDRFWVMRTACVRLIPSRKLRAWVLWSWRRPVRFGRRHLDR